MKKKSLDWLYISIVSIALLAILFQLIHIYINGHEICLNNGCKFIEELTNIPPFLFNLIGLIYFLVLLILKLLENKHDLLPRILNLFLICGVSGEAILLPFQKFIAHHYCSYCIFLLCLLFLLVLIRGVEIFLLSISVLLSGILIFSLLNFSTAIIKQVNRGLVSGSFAQVITKSKSNNIKLFLIFSNKCPHCKKVLENIPPKLNIPLYLNPLSYMAKIAYINPKIKIERFKNYDPAVNLFFIKIIKDIEVPVLVIKKGNIISFIKGDKSIIKYLNEKHLINKIPKINNKSKNTLNEGCIFGTSCSEENTNRLF